MSAWNIVDSNTNKSQPVQGKTDSGSVSPYFTPSPGAQDPVGKMRVSTPQALIDTDFEYGQQPTKWESIALQNNRQSVYLIPQQPLTVTGLESSGTTTLTITGTFTVPANTAIFIQNSNNSNQNGWWWTIAGGTNTMTVITTNTSSAGNQFNATQTQVYRGYFYSGCGIQLGANAFTTDGTANVTVTTSSPHGLSVGSLIYVVGTSSTGTTVNGAHVVTTVAAQNTFVFTNSNGAVAAAAVTNSASTSVLFARAAGFVEARTFDGGVAFSAGSTAPDSQLIRQTRRYFRYQSGKGIQFSTGTSLCPTLIVTSLQGVGTTATVTTRYAHNLAVGCRIVVEGANQGMYNGTYTIATVPNNNSFTYTTSTTVSATPATGFPIRISPINWYGSSNRIGFFDQQNGLFFEYDGQTLFAVWRNSVTQINGSVSVTTGTATVTGTSTLFTSQLAVGDFVVIRGQSYRVTTIQSDATMTISPEYRGSTIAGALVSKTIDVRVPRSQWLDPLDGTGPSGYTLDLTKMQMFYIDYSWYGAGFARWGLRTAKGQVSYVYIQQNNNLRFEAYMRSGNLAAHYESNGISPTRQLLGTLGASATTTTSAVASNATTIPVTSSAGFSSVGGVAAVGSEKIFYSGISGNNLIGCTRGFNNTAANNIANGASVTPDSVAIGDATNFAPSGTIRVNATGGSGAAELMLYSAKSGNFLFGLTRAQSGGVGAAQTFTVTDANGGNNPYVQFASPDSNASLSHWGSSVIMDGQFNDDKSLVFNYGTTTAITTTSTTPIIIMALRIAPSVDNGSVGLLGVKEVINRSQLQLETLGLYTTGTGYLINLVLNGYASGAMSGSFVSPVQLANGITSSFAQIATNTNAVNVIGGESLFAAYSNTSGNTTIDLSSVRDLGNSILGGGTSNTVPTSQAGFYPDGPDILYIVATPLSSTSSTILARLNWKEAQA